VARTPQEGVSSAWHQARSGEVSLEKSLPVFCTPNDPRGPWVVAHRRSEQCPGSGSCRHRHLAVARAANGIAVGAPSQVPVVAHLLNPIPPMIGTRSNPMVYLQVFVALGIPLLRHASLLHAPCLGCGGAQGRTGDLMAGCTLGLAIIEPVRPCAPPQSRCSLCSALAKQKTLGFVPRSRGLPQTLHTTLRIGTGLVD